MSATPTAVPAPGGPLLPVAGGAPFDAWRYRMFAAAVFVPSAVILGIARWLHPDPSGMGTHQQLGLPPCSFLATTGMPGVACGMTTAYAHAARGHILTAFATQPAGTVLCLMTTIAAIVSLYAMIVGISLAPLAKLIWRPSFAVLMIVLVLASWGYTLTIHAGH